jgi:hypothetical protein
MRFVCGDKFASEIAYQSAATTSESQCSLLYIREKPLAEANDQAVIFPADLVGIVSNNGGEGKCG